MKIMDKAAFEEQNVFGLGAPNDAFARYFAGRSYLNPLTRPEDGLFLANVTFEPGCRNNWHIHHASEGGGQLLICTAGEGQSFLFPVTCVVVRLFDITNSQTAVFAKFALKVFQVSQFLCIQTA